MKRKNEFSISYNKENSIFSLAVEGAKSVDSDIRGNAVIDYDQNGNIVRIDLHNFSFDEFKKSEKALKNVINVIKL